MTLESVPHGVSDTEKGYGSWQDYGARWYSPELGRWAQVDPMASARNWVSPYNYVQNNPIGRIDPQGMIDDWYQNNETRKVEWHEGSGKKDGYTHLGSTVTGTDQDGNTMYGAQDGNWYNSVPLAGATITAKPVYKESAAYSMFGELASGKNLGSDNPYLPYQGPDAISIQLNVSASGFLGESGFCAGIAFSDSELGAFASTYGGVGVSAPGIGLSFQVNFHNRTLRGSPSLSNIGGIDAGGSVGLGLIGGYSRSVQIKGGAITPIEGFRTYSIDAGVGGGLPLGGRASISTTGYIPIIKK